MKNPIIRSIYFYAVSIIALFMLVFSVVDLLNLGLKQWVFTQADEYYSMCVPYKPASAAIDPQIKTGPTEEDCAEQDKQNEINRVRNRQSSAVRDFSMLAVALPLFLFHFRIVQKERKEA